MKIFRKKVNWSDFVLEVLTIIIGISIAFAVENWKENREERALELNLLLELEHDLSATKKKLYSLISVNEDKLAGIKKFKEKVYESDSAFVHINGRSELLWTWLDSFDPLSMTYEVIKSSGNSRLMQNQELLFEVYRLYEELEKLSKLTKYNAEQIGKYVDPILYSHYSTEALVSRDSSLVVDRKEMADILMLKNQMHLFEYDYQNQKDISTWLIVAIDHTLQSIGKRVAEIKD